MKKSFNFLLFLSSLFLITSCTTGGDGSSSSQASSSSSHAESNSSSESSSGDESTSSIASSSHEESSSEASSVSSGPIVNQFPTFDVLNSKINELKVASIYAFGYTHNDENGYYDHDIQLNSQEMLDAVVNLNNGAFGFHYIGYKNNQYYTLHSGYRYIYCWNVGDEEDDDLTAQEAEAKLSSDLANYLNLSYWLNDEGMGAPFASKYADEFVVSSYDSVTDEDGISSIEFTGYFIKDGTSPHYYEYQIGFDDQNSLDTIMCTYYSSDNMVLWNSAKGKFYDTSAEGVVKHTYKISDVIFGEPLVYNGEDINLLDPKLYYMSKCTINSLTADGSNPKVGDSFLLSEANMTYELPMAYDQGSLYVKEISDPSMISLSEDNKGGTFLKAGEVTITYATPFAGVLGSITVTIEEA